MVKKVVPTIPKDKEELEEFLAQIGKELRDINKIGLKLKPKIAPLEAEMAVAQAEEAKLQAKISLLRSKEMDNIEPHEEKISELVEGASAYAKAHRDELTEGQKLKTVKLLTGILEWRKAASALDVYDEELALESLKSLGLQEFIKIKETVDKVALKKKPDKAKTVESVKITQTEKFFIIPTDLEAILGYTEKLEI